MVTIRDMMCVLLRRIARLARTGAAMSTPETVFAMRAVVGARLHTMPDRYVLSETHVGVGAGVGALVLRPDSLQSPLIAWLEPSCGRTHGTCHAYVLGARLTGAHRLGGVVCALERLVVRRVKVRVSVAVHKASR